ncbi:MAG: hypothetical protein M3542_03885 [Acidobacteriota bacterium]|nr:hypothetical protein [Acidobacteriota bacterium]MDQ5871234.1 hypothetical protein [Acidobacteriota bacterium]
MAKPPRETIERIVQRDMPGYKLVDKKPEPPARDSAARPAADTPDVQALREKYLRRRSPSSDERSSARPHESQSDRPTSATDEDAIVAVEPENRSRDGQLPGGGRSKRVVISGEKKEIIGRQG